MLAGKSREGTKRVLREQVKYITRHGSVLSVSALVSNLLALLVIVAYNYVGAAERAVEHYGIYTYIVAAASLVGITSLQGMTSAILVGTAQSKPHILRSASRRRVKFSFLLGCPALLLASLITLFWFPEQKAVGYACLCLLPVFPFMYSFTGVYSYLSGRRQFGAFAAVQVFAAFLNLISVAVCLWLWPDWPALPPVAALVCKTLFEWGLYLALVRRDRIPLLDQDGHLLSYGMKISLTGVTGTVETHIDRIIVGLIYKFQDLGMFGGGRAIVLPLRQMAQVYYQLYAPKLARKTPAEAWRLTNRALAWGLAAVIPAFALLYWALPWLYDTFLNKFDSSGPYARLFLIMVFVGMPWYFYYPFFQSQRQARREIIVRWTRSGLVLIGMLVLIKFYGIIGVIYAEIMGTAVMSVQSWWQARKSRGAGEAELAAQEIPPAE